MKKQLKPIIVAILTIAVAFQSTQNVYAYKTNGYKVTNPSNVLIYANASTNTWAGSISTYAKKWNSCSEITVNAGTSGNAVINYYGDYNTNNGTYGVTVHTSSSTSSITFYYAFTQTTNINRYETIVHETGHALGLAHCEESKNSISVMRETGFNGKAEPLSDDIAGISYIY